MISVASNKRVTNIHDVHENGVSRRKLAIGIDTECHESSWVEYPDINYTQAHEENARCSSEHEITVGKILL